METKKDIGPQFITIAGTFIIVGVVFLAYKNYLSGGKLFSVGFLGLFFIFGLLVFVKGIRNIKQQKSDIPQTQSKSLDIATSVAGTGLMVFFIFALLALVALYLIMHN